MIPEVLIHGHSDFRVHPVSMALDAMYSGEFSEMEVMQIFEKSVSIYTRLVIDSLLIYLPDETRRARKR